MLWYCAFKWHAHTTREQVATRFTQQHQLLGERAKAMVRGWYSLAGGSAGYLLLESDDPREVTALLQPYADLMAIDVHAVYALDYDTMVQTMAQVAQAAT